MSLLNEFMYNVVTLFKNIFTRLDYIEKELREIHSKIK